MGDPEVMRQAGGPYRQSERIVAIRESTTDGAPSLPLGRTRQTAARLELRGIGKAYGPVTALDGVDLIVEPGELLTILGPSGSSKTTLLKVVAGFENPETGTILLKGEDVTLIPPARRDVGMVFQNYALFPHMSVRDNVAFPLEMRRRPRTEIDARVQEALALVDLSAYKDRLPRQLSGGQQQRVALARAIVFEPLLLLLDEPFGALDRKLRDTMQLEVRRLQKRLAITTVFITHDQEEALVLSDRIAIMNGGRLEQVGRPAEIYNHPRNVFVADFVGESNILPGTVTNNRPGIVEVALDNGLRIEASGELPHGTRVGAMIRPERFAPAGADSNGNSNRFHGTVAEIVYIGVSHKYRLQLESGPEILLRLPAGKSAFPGVREPFAVTLAPEDVHLLRLV